MEISNRKLSRLFSPSTLRKLVDDSSHSFIDQIKQESDSFIVNGEFFDQAYA